MTKRSRKSAFGKANVVRRSSLKTIPVYARDPLSLDNAALRKNVRTTLLVGTALGVGVLAFTLFASEPAYAAIACTATGGNPAASAGPTVNYTGDQPNGIHCVLTPADPTIVVNTDGTGSIGGDTASAAGDGSGIQIDATGDGSVPGVSVTISNKDAIGNKAAPAFAHVTGNGIAVTLTDTSAGGTLTDTVTITNSGPIGLAGTPYGPDQTGIFVRSTTNVDAAGTASATGGNATNTVTITNSAAIFSGSDGINARNFANANATASDPTGTAKGGSAIAGMVITNTANITSSTQRG